MAKNACKNRAVRDDQAKYCCKSCGLYGKKKNLCKAKRRTEEENPPLYAMIFAAGLGSRLGEETSNRPKALVEIQGKTLLERAILKLKKHGFTKLIINVHHFADQIIEFLKIHDNFGVDITISDERELLLETGGGLKKAAPLLKNSRPILLYNVDVITDLNLHLFYKWHCKNNALATLALRKRETSRYLLFNKKMAMKGWMNSKTGERKPADVEDKKYQKLAFSGIHVIDPKLLDLLPDENRFSITPLYIELCQSNTIMGYDHSEGFWLDVGKPETYKAAQHCLLPTI